MQTPQEYVEQKPLVMFVHALEAVEYCLQGGDTRTAYPSPNRAWTFFYALKTAMERGAAEPPEEFGEIEQQVFNPRKRTREVDSENGEINIDRYLNRERLCFDEPVKIPQDAPSVSIVLDMAIPWGERESQDMAARHKEVYRLALEAEANQIPCRVIAAVGMSIPERRDNLRCYLVVKDYDDPIFQGIWGALATNATTNDFVNVLMDFLIGTRADGNGRPTMIDVAQDIDDDEIILIQPRRLQNSRAGR